ncbi:AMP-binding protein [Brevibacterium salitolerans]|uniref:AMP-dependent synthetase/ligase domain-containing protein n=1 Tax=Brevibacterium salitolerans TaxID=1403566 RepID=A0ABN2WYG4_9MICO
MTRPLIVDQVSRMLAGEAGLLLPRDRGGLVRTFGPAEFDPADTGRRAPALVLFTSGSTGAPKGVGLSLEALTASATETERLLVGPGRWHLCLPSNHIAGLQVVFRALLAGAAPSVARPGPFDAGRFAADLTALQGRAGEEPVYTSLVPTQLVRVLALPEAAAAAARCAAVLLGGAAVSPRLLERAAEAGIPIVRTYGMSETAGGCVYDGVPFPEVRVDLDTQGRVLLAGPVLADGYLEVAESQDGREAPEGGESPEQAEALERAEAPSALRLTAVPNGPVPAAGGAEGIRAGADTTAGEGIGSESQEAEAERLAAEALRPGFWGEGPARFLVTSDLGRWVPAAEESHGAAEASPGAARRLEILGRADDIIVTGGENVSPHEVEAHLLRVAEPLGYREVLVSSVPDEEWGRVLVALLVPADAAERHPSSAGGGTGTSADPLLHRIQAGLRARGLSAAMLPRAAHTVSALPVRGIGKPDRRAAQTLAAELQGR